MNKREVGKIVLEENIALLLELDSAIQHAKIINFRIKNYKQNSKLIKELKPKIFHCKEICDEILADYDKRFLVIRKEEQEYLKLQIAYQRLLVEENKTRSVYKVYDFLRAKKDFPKNNYFFGRYSPAYYCKKKPSNIRKLEGL